MSTIPITIYPVPATTAARIVKPGSAPPPPGWALAPLADAGRVGVAFDPARTGLTVVHGEAGDVLTTGLAAAGFRRFATAGEATANQATAFVRETTPPPIRPDDHERADPVTVSVTEAARMLGVSRDLAYDLARRGEIPVVRLGRRMVVPTARLRRLIEGDPATTTDPASRRAG